MSRPRIASPLTSAERVRAFRARQRQFAFEACNENLASVTKTPDGSFCEWFPWAKGCNLDLMGRSSANVITPSHPRFQCKGDPLHPAWWATS